MTAVQHLFHTLAGLRAHGGVGTALLAAAGAAAASPVLEEGDEAVAREAAAARESEVEVPPEGWGAAAAAAKSRGTERLKGKDFAGAAAEYTLAIRAAVRVAQVHSPKGRGL